MAKVKIITSNKSRVNQELITSIGKVKFDENLIAELDEKDATELMIHDSTLKLFVVENPSTASNTGTGNKTTAQNTEKPLSDAEAAKKQRVQEAKDKADKVIKDQLNEKTIEELTTICEAFPKEEWEGKEKSELIDYIMSK